MGQDLFYPPNVFGWPGGRNWLNSRALVARINFAAALVDGAVRYPAAPANVLELVERAVGGAGGRSGNPIPVASCSWASNRRGSCRNRCNRPSEPRLR